MEVLNAAIAMSPANRFVSGVHRFQDEQLIYLSFSQFVDDYYSNSVHNTYVLGTTDFEQVIRWLDCWHR